MPDTMEKTESREWVIIENEGQRLFAVLHRPLHVENPPIVVVLHGFASSKQGTSRGYVRLAERLTQQGIACLRFDFRGAGDSEGDLSVLSLEDLVSDAVCVCHYIEHLEGIDAQRIGLFGASLGGSIAILSTALHRLTKALVLWAPVASGELWYRDFIRAHPEFMQAHPSQVAGTYKGVKLNPTFREQFGRMRAYETLSSCTTLPILHMHGKDDSQISIDHQQAFKKACAHLQMARFITFSETEHSFGRSKVFAEAVQETVNWFKKYL